MPTKIACIHCGFVFEDEDMEVCPVCGTELGQEWDPSLLKSFVVTELTPEQAAVIAKLLHKKSDEILSQLASDGCIGLDDLTPAQVEAYAKALNNAGIKFAVETPEQKAVRVQEQLKARAANDAARAADLSASAEASARACAEAEAKAKEAEAVKVATMAKIAATKAEAERQAAETARVEATAKAKEAEAIKIVKSAEIAAAAKAKAEAEAKAKEAEAVKVATMAKIAATKAEAERQAAEAARVEATAKAKEAEAIKIVKSAEIAAAAKAKAEAEAKAKEAEAIKAGRFAEAKQAEAKEAAAKAAADAAAKQAQATIDAEKARLAAEESKAAIVAEKTKQMELEAAEAMKKHRLRISQWICASILLLILLFVGWLWHAGYESERTAREKARLAAMARARKETMEAAEKKAAADRLAAEKRAEADRIAAAKQAELDRIAAAQEAERNRIAAERRAVAEAKAREEVRIEAARRAEAERRAEAARRAEAERRAEAARRAEAERRAEAARRAEAKRRAEAEKRAAAERAFRRMFLCAHVSRWQLPNGVSLEMVGCLAGSFMMGSPSNESGRFGDEVRHRVTLTKPFLIGKYEVTQSQYEAVTEENPSRFKGANRPVECVSWNDAMAFCQKLNRLTEGKRPAGYKFSLPTEAQWEYACRAGTTTAFNGDFDLWQLGWYEKNSDDQTHDVGWKEPNAWGIYDMHGNVCEWCRDWKEAYTRDATDPVGPSSGSSRVYRGGSWNSFARHCRSAFRDGYAPGDRNYYLGFRVALVPVQ